MRTTRGVIATVGVAMMAFAVIGTLASPHHINLPRQILFLIVSLLLHDAVLGPIFVVVGLLLRRVVGPPYRGIVTGALVVTAGVTFVALPLMLGFGRIPDNPSALPRNYVGGYAILLGVIWSGAALLIVWRRIRRRDPQR